MNKIKYLRCKKCNRKEDIETINESAVTKLLITREPIPVRTRKKDGLLIYPLYCLKCKLFTEWAADPFNFSGNAIDKVEYFKTFKNKSLYKFFFKPIEIGLVERGYTKAEHIKYGIGWFIILVIIISIIRNI